MKWMNDFCKWIFGVCTQFDRKTFDFSIKYFIVWYLTSHSVWVFEVWANNKFGLLDGWMKKFKNVKKITRWLPTVTFIEEVLDNWKQ